jgi:glycine/D-amino acid oxidase-like deaminating enzyme
MSAKKSFVVIGCGGAGGPAAILTSKINPDIDVTVIRAEPNFIVR